MPHATATIAPARKARTRRTTHHRPGPVRPSPARPVLTVMPLWQALATDGLHP
ncbi:hypothetical protein [Streptomyces sp. NPDC002588]|uniref:hypothetical protein n=1 Tax=Streptomyces sp. NPDC002588 TaxID=3154419 RepID=UPI0033233697